MREKKRQRVSTSCFFVCLHQTVCRSVSWSVPMQSHCMHLCKSVRSFRLYPPRRKRARCLVGTRLNFNECSFRERR